MFLISILISVRKREQQGPGEKNHKPESQHEQSQDEDSQGGETDFRN